MTARDGALQGADRSVGINYDLCKVFESAVVTMPISVEIHVLLEEICVLFLFFESYCEYDGDVYGRVSTAWDFFRMSE